MKAVFLGTGTSCGVPIIGCDCAVCCSDDPRNKRRRTSLWLETGEVSIVVDTSADFRDQVLTFGVKRLDAVLITRNRICASSIVCIPRIRFRVVCGLSVAIAIFCPST